MQRRSLPVAGYRDLIDINLNYIPSDYNLAYDSLIRDRLNRCIVLSKFGHQGTIGEKRLLNWRGGPLLLKISKMAAVAPGSRCDALSAVRTSANTSPSGLVPTGVP